MRISHRNTNSQEKWRIHTETVRGSPSRFSINAISTKWVSAGTNSGYHIISSMLSKTAAWFYKVLGCASYFVASQGTLCTESLQLGRRESWLFGAYLKLRDLFHMKLSGLLRPALPAFLRSTCQLHASLQFFVWMGSGLLTFSDHTRTEWCRWLACSMNIKVMKYHKYIVAYVGLLL